MADAIWRWDELVAGSGGEAEGQPQAQIDGISIDSRTLEAGDLFVALKAERDGHEFVPLAFRRGAAAALVARSYQRSQDDGALVRADDPLRALESLGRAARSRLAPDARVIAVTGSAGKTGTKEMLRACLARVGRVHASDKSYNNHWGVPLTLARMPSGTDFAVCEIGMNHAGEITPLSRMARPHLALITNVLPVHLGQFPNEAAIADAKAEIFAGLEPGGVAILNRDNPHFARVAQHAKDAGARICSFGRHAEAHVRARQILIDAAGSTIAADVLAYELAYRVGAVGEHLALNSLGVVATLAQALSGAGTDWRRALGISAAALADVRAARGRGARTELAAGGGTIMLIDESYNANPASMKAALAALATVPRQAFPRRIAVLGEMLELGSAAAELHRGLKDAVDAAGVDLVFACGPNMRLLFELLAGSVQGHWSERAADLAGPLVAALGAGDAVMVKGSLGTRMAPLVDAISDRFSARSGAAV